MPVKINSSGGGSVSLTVPSTAADSTLTLPATNGNIITSADSNTVTQAMLTTNVACSGPAFSAYQNVAQSLTGASWNKITCQQEEFDVPGCYDNVTNYRFTPNVAGYYQVSGAFGIASTVGDMVASIAKNGTRVKAGAEIVTGGGGGYVSALIYLNGSTDYVELYGYNGPGTQNTTAGQTVTWFQAYLVRAA